MKATYHRQSFRGRVTAAILFTCVAVLLLGCTLFMLEQRHSAEGGARRWGTNLAHTFAQAESDPVARRDLPNLRRSLAALSHMDRVTAVRVTDIAGHTLAGFGFPHPVAGALMEFTTPVLHDDRPVGRLVLSMRLAPAIILSQMIGLGGALFFVSTGVALFLGRWLAERITRPVARLCRAMADVGETGVFAVHLAPDAPDEIGQLTASFNALMDRLEMKDQALRRTVAELVEARDHAEAANVAKSQFLANMSHEIRTPLNGVLAMAQVMSISELAPAHQEQVEVISQSGHALLSLLNDILDVSKIEAGKLELEVADFDAEAVAREACANFAPVADKKGLNLRLEIQPSARGIRCGDAARLRQILNNFLSNALKFTTVGEVQMTLAGVGDDGADGLIASVRDSGIGIPADKRTLLFRKFSQVDTSTTRRYGGTGLGLAICRELAEMMGGQVWLDSEEGRGSTFHLSLPLVRVAEASPVVEAPAAEAPMTDMAEPGAAPAALRVLAAEDNATNQLVLSTVMEIFGYELIMVADGVAAVEAWRGDRFDVILMDIQMPRMDGVTAARIIRDAEAAEGRPRTPIVALSANALVHQIEEYRAAGMDDHVAKPIELDKLQAVLDSVMATQAQAIAA